MRTSFILAEERSMSAVPAWVMWFLAAALLLQLGLQVPRPAPVGRAEQLETPPPEAVLRVASLGEPITTSHLLTLYLQAFDNQPGISIPFRDIDYARVRAWLSAALRLDPIGQYPLMLAAQVYALVNVEEKQRYMMEFVYQEFLADPDRRWRWLAHCSIMARHRLNDMKLSMKYADAISKHAGSASGWARQMRIFMLADMGETDRAAVLLGGLLANGEVTDAKEIHFLTERLEELKASKN